ncbi:MAG: phosphotransferase family protein [Haliea sp.]|uniref:phosphotransferase family protein n=1 Tax=Haliea sp. TaxID=1932666 RepID=UPI000C46264F|nr:phosphotransferase family protein [Haliea sp.]MBM68505.1 phosphotransferase family protein [Haliea sp.]|tara:strand:- start:85337 stop:86398 length:1062 start_codon:yes stop_codon:yes gene_type:complete
MAKQESVDRDLVDLDRLGEWMQAQRLPSGPFLNQRLLTGGTQNILLYFERGDRAFVLRRPPKHLRASSNRVMCREARVLQALAGSNVPHPGYIAHCEDESVLGAAFFLMEPVDGFNPVNGLPELHRGDAALRRRMGESHIEALATLGSLDYKELGLAEFGKPDGYLQRQPGRWRGELESYAALDGYDNTSLPYESRIYQWLADHIPEDFQPGIIHGDCHLANTLFNYHNGELAALIDWEMSTIGDPLLDLGWVMATSDDGDGFSTASIEPRDGFPSIAEMVAHYSKHSHRNLSSLQWYAVLACYKLGAILEGTHARACAGKADKAIGEKLHQLTLGLFRRAHHWIEHGIPTSE